MDKNANFWIHLSDLLHFLTGSCLLKPQPVVMGKSWLVDLFLFADAMLGTSTIYVFTFRDQYSFHYGRLALKQTHLWNLFISWKPMFSTFLPHVPPTKCRPQNRKKNKQFWTLKMRFVSIGMYKFVFFQQTSILKMPKLVFRRCNPLHLFRSEMVNLGVLIQLVRVWESGKWLYSSTPMI